jgi:nitroreductase
MTSLMKQIQSHLEYNQTGSNAGEHWWANLTQWFNSPNGVILYIDSSLGEWSILDAGMALQNLMLAAWHYGVGTCVMAAAVHHPDVLRDVFNIPQSKPIATFRSTREPLDKSVIWHGFA